MSDSFTKITINPNGNASVQRLTQMGDFTYFRAFYTEDGVANWWLWKTDGTKLGTDKIKQIDQPDSLIVMDNTLYFNGRDSILGRLLWKSDGTTDGTILVTGAPNKVGALTVMPVDGVNYLYFSADNDSNLCELWRTNGTTT